MTVPLLAAFYALHHTLVKGGLFLAIGVAARTKTPGLWLVLVPAAVIALNQCHAIILDDTIAPKVLWDSLWPVVVGGLLAVALHRWNNKLPRTSAGDVFVAKGAIVSLGQNLSVCMERVNWGLRGGGRGDTSSRYDSDGRAMYVGR